MPKYAVTFCNSGGAKIAIIKDNQVYRRLDLTESDLGAAPTSITGATMHQGNLIVAVHSTPLLLVFLDKHLTVEKITKLPQAKDIHGITSNGNEILVASTGTNQIISVNSVSGSVEAFWFNGDSLSDTIHLNDIGIFNGKIYGSHFGLRHPNQVRSGGIVDVSDGKSFAEHLREPHSVMAYDNDIYVLESGTGDLLKFTPGFAPQRVLGVAGYARGLAIDATHFAIGKSGYRKESRHGVGDGRMPPFSTSDAAAEWLRLSGVFVVERSTQKANFIDTTAIGAEIYQIVQLPDEFATAPEPPAETTPQTLSADASSIEKTAPSELEPSGPTSPSDRPTPATDAQRESQ
jgi:uncharacterized protein YodC (DUF2158 family)